MTLSTKQGFAAVAFAIITAAVLAMVALAMRLGAGWVMATSMFPAFFCVFVGITEERRRTGRRNRASMSIKDELALRKLRGQGARVQFR